MKIYTRFGDSGKTQVLGGVQLDKSDERIETIGELDELNSMIGMSLSQLNGLPDLNESISSESISSKLIKVQYELFEWGAMLAGAKPNRHQLPGDDSLLRLEQEIDQWQSKLPQMTHFILPGGSAPGASLHLARAVSRRAERRLMSSILTLKNLPGSELNKPANEQLISGSLKLQKYLNRLGDWLFVAARVTNEASNQIETKWIPDSNKTQ